MFGIPSPWKIGGIAAGIALLLAVGWGTRVNHLRAGWQDRWTILDGQARGVLAATQSASDNPKLKWSGVTRQINELGGAISGLKRGIENQNRSIADMANEAVRLKAKASELREIANKAQAQRKVALARLDDMATTPGTRADCQALLKEADDALNVVRDAGL